MPAHHVLELTDFTNQESLVNLLKEISDSVSNELNTIVLKVAEQRHFFAVQNNAVATIPVGPESMRLPESVINNLEKASIKVENLGKPNRTAAMFYTPGRIFATDELEAQHRTEKALAAMQLESAKIVAKK